jgi:hypothetical protein
LFLVVAGLLLMRWHWRAQFHRRIEAIRAAGYPMTGKDLDASYPWSETGDNAAHWITGAATYRRDLPQEDSRRLERLVSRSGEGPDSNEPLPAETLDLLEQHIRDNSEALETLHDAAGIAECRYPVEFSKGPSTRMSHLTDVRDNSLLLCQEALLRAEQGDPNGTTQALEAALRVAGSLDKEPVLISHLLHLGMSSWAAYVLERALNRVEFTVAQLARLQLAFQRIRADEGLLQALAGYRCMYLTVFERPQALDRQYFQKLPPVALLEVYDALGLAAREGIIFLEYIDECLRIARLPAFQRLAAVAVAETHHRRKGKVLLLGPANIFWGPGMIRVEVKYVAQLEMAKALLAVERYRLAHGELPETLAALVPDYLPAVPADPFDGAPLRYRRLDRGFLVYSVGEDAKDDGGKDEPSGQKKPGETCDLVFRVER